MQLQMILENIRPADAMASMACAARFDKVAKPLGSLGKLESLLAKIAAVYGSAEVDIGKKCVLVFCADNGVTAQGVTQCGSDVTTSIARMMVAGRSSVCVMARSCGADTFPVDVGMADTVKGMLNCKFAPGTADISRGPAMERETALAAIELGAALVKGKKEQGYRLIATGEAGIGNTTTASAMASVLLNQPLETVTGRGAGLCDEGLLRKRSAIARAIRTNAPDPNDPVDVLAKIGGLDIAALTGAFLGGACYHVPMVMDGVISAVAALVAVRLNPAVRDYILPSHISAEPAGQIICRELDLEPMLHGDMRLGEGTGAVALFPLLDMAAAVYHSAATFEDIAVEAYTRQSC
ncbi:MAG: nicotinate-nucleotide--dimethylbenzimidazole phosphoribosyltransferase [Candidatus Pelethousia sp.]|nr:nicotinate-nucleotide--dimethylbenzimidazole phosphoribosyltransferase [Candidatus Pelethousia sp.]